MAGISLSLVLYLLTAGTMAQAEPVEISSDSLHVSHQESQAEFKGKVQLKRGDFELSCDRLVAHYEQNVLSRADAFGQVLMQQLEKKGAADHATYHADKASLTLMGHASVGDQKSTVRGETVVYHLDTKQSQVLNSKQGERVNMQIETPDEESAP
ncbi:MAG: lipopolysaccharide transport periplasmic protein LptA [Zetaproteobacteria bacterium CG1_02_49_23]|nr:MAG: lipopolysaccharide transport periplasmic protein LptA [Zetaproteobacteria bacterium CG1_02_49_23]